MIKIEKNIPIPDTYKKARIKWSQILPKLKIGDSFVVESWQVAANAATQGRYHGMKLVFKTAEGVTRVWRIE